MPLKTIDKGSFIYIAYRRDGFQDFDLFRKTIAEHVKNNGTPSDIVIDLSKSESITEAEIALLVNIMREFQMTTRHLRIVSTTATMHKLRQFNLGRSGNVHLYSDHQSLISEMNPPAQ